MSAPRRNRYQGRCTRCQDTVFPGDGTTEKVNGRWAVTHDTCPADVQAAHEARMAELKVENAAYEALPVEERITRVSQRNPYMAGKANLVRHAASLEDAQARISASSQGMTMDYMSEFARESEANRLALELAESLFAAEVSQ